LNLEYAKTLLSGLFTKLRAVQNQIIITTTSLQKSIDQNKKEIDKDLVALESNLRKRITTTADSTAENYGIPLLKATWIQREGTSYPHIYPSFGLVEGSTFRVLFSSTGQADHFARYIYIGNTRIPLYIEPPVGENLNYNNIFMTQQEAGVCYLIVYRTGACYIQGVQYVYTDLLRTGAPQINKYLKGGGYWKNPVVAKTPSEVFADIMPSVTVADNAKLLGVLAGKWSVVDPPTSFVVVITPNDSGVLSADKTLTDTLAACKAGKVVKAKFDTVSLELPLADYNDSQIVFRAPQFSGNRLTQWAQVTMTASEITTTAIPNDVVIASSTTGSTKLFKLTVDDSGTISATEVTS